MGTDDKALIEVFTLNSNERLQEISAAYKLRYGTSLAAAVNLDTSGDFGDFLVMLLIPTTEVKTYLINRSLILLGTDEQALIDTLAHATNEDVAIAKQEYHRVFKKDLVPAVSGDTSGNFKKTLLGILEGCRECCTEPDCARAEKDAEEIYKRGEGKFGTDDDYFVSFFTKTAFEQIYETDRAYQKKYTHGLAKAIESETSGDYKDLLIAISTPELEWWAKRVKNALSGLGTKDDILKRVFVINNNPTKLGAISGEYMKLYGKSLVDAIHGDTSGPYRQTYMSLLKNIGGY